ncbi:hypothetical protein PINS_up013389 [Pythium insidiosum]|nr:hypothetical protein PINS_up013389 [Pythium insidiosum]
MPFEWSATAVPLLRAPWRPTDTSAQRHVVADVRVVEQTAPSYALVVTANVPGLAKALRREVTKQHLTTIFDAVVSRRDGGAVASVVTVARHKGSRSRVETAVDNAVDAWLRRSAKAPTREQLVIWLLSRLVVVVENDSGAIALCGEPEAQVRSEVWERRPSSKEETVEVVATTENEDEEEEDDGADVPAFIVESLSPLPPSYEQSRSRRSRRNSTRSPPSGEADEDVAFASSSADYAERHDEDAADDQQQQPPQQAAGEDPAPATRALSLAVAVSRRLCVPL